MKRLLLGALTVISTLSFAGQPATVLGVVASTSDLAAKKQGDALVKFIEATLKDRALYRVYKDQEALAKALSAGEVDLAVMGPLAYLRTKPGAARLLLRTVRKGKSTYRSVIFGPAKSKVTSMEALKKYKGTLKAAWTETSSASGYIVPKAYLLSEGINPVQAFDTQDFLGSHDAVCKAVLEGRYDVGATFSDSGDSISGCEAALGRNAQTLKVIGISEPVPNDVLVANQTFSEGKGKALFDAAKEAKASTLSAALLADGVAEVTDADFEPIRKALDAFVP